ncbi:MAG: hypothetical protein HUU55_00560 [Myxococcales bacterium]|nr:hypothetical protein [Myxococcales bacterium]
MYHFRFFTLKSTVILLGLIAFGAFAPIAFATNAAVVVSGGESSARGYQLLIQQALSEKGIPIVDPIELQGAHPISEDILPILQRDSITRLFTLEITPLGSRDLVSLTERSATDLKPIYASKMSMAGADEAEVILPRLTDAVLERKKTEEVATVENVGTQESRPLEKRAGEFYWGGGIAGAMTMEKSVKGSYGGFLRGSFETVDLRVDLTLGGYGSEDMAMGDFSIAASYLFLNQDISPFLGGGLGYLVYGVANSEGDFRDGNGLAFTLTTGVEFLRLYPTRLIVEVKFLLPTFQVSEAGEKNYAPIGMFAFSFLF